MRTFVFTLVTKFSTKTLKNFGRTKPLQSKRPSDTCDCARPCKSCARYARELALRLHRSRRFGWGLKLTIWFLSQTTGRVAEINRTRSAPDGLCQGLRRAGTVELHKVQRIMRGFQPFADSVESDPMHISDGSICEDHVLSPHQPSILGTCQHLKNSRRIRVCTTQNLTSVPEREYQIVHASKGFMNTQISRRARTSWETRNAK